MAREYITKERSGRKAPSTYEDVSIHMNKSGVISGIQRYACIVSFNKDSVKRISNTGYILVSIDRDTNRLYFESGNENNGYKIGFPKDCRRYYIRFTVHDAMYFAKFSGEYKMKKDELEGIYYISAK